VGTKQPISVLKHYGNLHVKVAASYSGTDESLDDKMWLVVLVEMVRKYHLVLNKFRLLHEYGYLHYLET